MNYRGVSLDKKTGVFLVFVVLSLLIVNQIHFALAQVDTTGFEEAADKILDEAEKRQKQLEGFTEKDKWVYLSEEWKKILLQNKFVKGLDTFLSKINFVFLILFGQDYDLSLTLIFTVIFFLFFMLSFFMIFGAFSPFSPSVSALLSIGFSIILSQIQVNRLFAETAFKVIFYREGAWGWISFVLLLVLIILILSVENGFASSVKARKEEEQKLLEARSRQEVIGFAETLKSALKPRPSSVVEGVDSFISAMKSAVTFEDARDIYRKAVAKFHPDRGGSHEEMVKINTSWAGIKQGFGK